MYGEIRGKGYIHKLGHGIAKTGVHKKNRIVLAGKAVLLIMVLVLLCGCDDDSRSRTATATLHSDAPRVTAAADDTAANPANGSGYIVSPAAPVENSMDETVPGESFVNEIKQYEISLPEGWSIDGKAAGAPEEEKERDIFSSPEDKSAVLCVKILENQPGSAFDISSNKVINTYLKTLFEGSSGTWEEKSREKVFIGGYLSELLQCNAVIKNDQQQIKKSLYLTYTMAGRRIFMATGEAYGEKWNSAAPVLKQALLSLQILDTKGSVQGQTGQNDEK